MVVAISGRCRLKGVGLAFSRPCDATGPKGRGERGRGGVGNCWSPLLLIVQEKASWIHIWYFWPQTLRWVTDYQTRGNKESQG